MPKILSPLLISTLSLGMLLGVVLVPGSPPPALAPATKANSVYAISEEYDASSAVQIELTLGAKALAHSARSGTLSEFRCVVGQPFESMSSAVSIDGVPLLTVASSVPMWRNLRQGDVGSDVNSLREALRAAGADIESSGPLDQTVVASLNQHLRAIGAADLISEGISKDAIVWIPSSSSRARDCGASVGDLVESGQVLVTFAPPIVGASLSTKPLRSVKGAFVIDIGGVTVDLSTDGEILDVSSLSELVAEEPSGEDAARPLIQGQYRLNKPVQAYVLPPSSVIIGDKGTDAACVLQGEVKVKVSVLGSELGRTFVATLDDQKLARVQLRPPPDTSCE